MTAPSSCRWRRSCTARCARRSRDCRRCIARAAIASAGPCSPARSSTAREYLNALDKLSSLRLCSNVPGQWAVQTALGGYQSIHELTRSGRTVVRVAARDSRRRRTQQVPAGACAARRDLRLRRREGRRAAGLRRSAVRDGPARAQARAARAGHELQCALQDALSDHQSADARKCWPTCSGAWRSCWTATRPASEPVSRSAPELKVVRK